jgi:small subunit ribosomal protein S16
MATKIRLQRFGKKGKPFYHIVAADSRQKRDGKNIEKIGTYNPNTNPANININHERALHWVQVGAIPTETVRSILSYTGVLMKKHLMDGVKKGAHNEEEALKKFENWLEEKSKLISLKTSSIEKLKAESAKKALEAEKLSRQKKEEKIALKNKPKEEAAKSEDKAEEKSLETNNSIPKDEEKKSEDKAVETDNLNPKDKSTETDNSIPKDGEKKSEDKAVETDNLNPEEKSTETDNSMPKGGEKKSEDKAVETDNLNPKKK